MRQKSILISTFAASCLVGAALAHEDDRKAFDKIPRYEGPGLRTGTPAVLGDAALAPMAPMVSGRGAPVQGLLPAGGLSAQGRRADQRAVRGQAVRAAGRAAALVADALRPVGHELGVERLGLHLALGARVRADRALRRHGLRRDHRSRQPGQGRDDPRPEQPVARRAHVPELRLRGLRGRQRHPGHQPLADRQRHRDAGQHGHDRRGPRDAHGHDQRGHRLPLPRRRRRQRPAHLQPGQSGEPGLRRLLAAALRARGHGREVHLRALRGEGDRLRLRRPERRLPGHGRRHPRRDQQEQHPVPVARDLLGPRLLPPGLALRGPEVPLHRRRARRGGLDQDDHQDPRHHRPLESGRDARVLRLEEVDRAQPLRQGRSDLRGQLHLGAARVRRDRSARTGRDGVVRHLPGGQQRAVQQPLAGVSVLPERRGDRLRHREGPLRLVGRGLAGELRLPRGPAEHGRAGRRHHPGRDRRLASRRPGRGHGRAALRRRGRLGLAGARPRGRQRVVRGRSPRLPLRRRDPLLRLGALGQRHHLDRSAGGSGHDPPGDLDHRRDARGVPRLRDQPRLDQGRSERRRHLRHLGPQQSAGQQPGPAGQRRQRRGRRMLVHGQLDRSASRSSRTTSTAARRRSTATSTTSRPTPSR